MSKSAWPVAADVTAALSALPNPITLPSGFDVDSQLAAAVSEWDLRTRYRPFFQTSEEPVFVPFDPPGPDGRGTTRGGSYRLTFGNGLISLASVFVGVREATGDTGYELTSGQDFYLGPRDAPAKGEPYTDLEFLTPRRGLPASIVVTGVWGYCADTIPDDAWQGVLDLAMSNCLLMYREGMSTGLIEVKDDEVTKRRSIELIGRMGDGVRAKGTRALGRYRLLF